jgi:hypothetical protein
MRKRRRKKSGYKRRLYPDFFRLLFLLEDEEAEEIRV